MKYFYLSWYVYNEFVFIVCPTIVTKLLIATFRLLTAGLHQRWCRFTMSTTTVASDEPQLMVARFRPEALYKTVSSVESAVITIGCYVVWSLIALGFISFRQQGWPDQPLCRHIFCLQKSGSSDLLVVLSIRLYLNYIHFLLN